MAPMKYFKFFSILSSGMADSFQISKWKFSFQISKLKILIFAFPSGGITLLFKFQEQNFSF
jgi:hypothetical protein